MNIREIIKETAKEEFHGCDIDAQTEEFAYLVAVKFIESSGIVELVEDLLDEPISPFVLASYIESLEEFKELL